MYDDAKFGVINRKWFGLTKKWGGDVAAGYTYATHGGTSITHLARWYPRGPIKITKAGSMVIATLSNASSDLHKGRVRTRSGSASVAVQWYVKNTSTQIIQAVFASNTPNLTAKGTASNSVTQCKAGEYISIMTATPTTDKGTRVQATTSGTSAFFVDYVSKYDSTNKWDVTV
jgi:hypothetical protein